MTVTHRNQMPARDTDAGPARSAGPPTRRGFLAGGLGAAVAVGLAACGSSGSSVGSGVSPSGKPAAPATRAVSTIHGKVSVPADPKRIAAFDFPEACALLDLGVVPVGRPSYMPAFAAYTKALQGVPAVDEASTGNLVIEEIAAVRPDLIVGDDWADPKQQRAPYPDLAKIAPTAIFAWQQAAGNWPDLAAQTAAAIGKTTALNALKQRYAAKGASIKAANAALFGRTTWDLIDCGKSSWDLYSTTSSHGQVLAGAGARLGAAKQQTTGYKQYSLEQLGLLARTDVIVTTPASLPFLRAQALFRGLPAVKAGRVYTTDLFFPASYGIALALLDQLAGMCAKVSAA